MTQVPAHISFDEVVRELSTPILRYLERMLGDRAKAEDLLQESLLRIQHGLPGFAGRAKLKTWAFSIANNIALDFLRQPAQRAKLVDIEEAANLSSDAPNLEERMIIDEMNNCVRDVIDSLPPDYRTALILHDIEGMAVEETADVVKCSPATAKIRIHRARQRLKAALAQQCAFYRDGDDVFRCTRNG